MSGSEVAENKMGTMPENKLLLSMSLPIMVSMLIQALYNIVDSWFVARISENALSAVSLAFPVQSLMIGISVGSFVGMGTVLSHSLGAKKFTKANDVATHGVFMGVCIYLVFLLIGIFVTKPFYYGQTDNPEILEGGISYLRICCMASFGLCMQFVFERILQSTGKPVYSMITQSLGAIINMILDPILIFGLCGFPKMGVTGAAIATVTGQSCAAILAFIFNQTKNKEIKIEIKHFKPDAVLLGQIYKIGLPSIIVQSIGAFMVYGMNLILIPFTSTAIAVFGIYFKLQSFVFLPVFGLNNGMTPIVAYNYGAEKKKRLLKVARLGLTYACLMMFAGFLVLEIFPGQLLKMFEASDTMLGIGIPALKIIAIHFLFAGINIIGLSVCQALGNAIFSMLTGMFRQLLILLPVAYLLSLGGNINSIWWAFPISESISVIFTGIFFGITYKKKIKPMKE